MKLLFALSAILFPFAIGDRTGVGDAEQASQRKVFKAANVLVAPGKSIPRGVIIVENGKIVAVGTDLGVPAGAEVRDFGNATIAPGLIDAHTDFGADKDITDTTFAMTPAVRAIDAFRPRLRSAQNAVKAGITCIALAPDGENLVGGIGAVVKPVDKGSTPRQEAFLKLSFASTAFDANRFPTSFGGGINALTTEWKRAFGELPQQSTLSKQDAAVIQRSRKDLPPWIEVDDEFSARRALNFAKELKLQPVFVASGDVSDAIPEIVAAKIPLVLRPLTISLTPTQLRTFQAVMAAKGEFAFATFGSRLGLSPEVLRTSAHMASALGLEKGAAWAAITTTPAKLLGVNESVGVIEVGHDADLAVYSGNPMLPTSSLVEIFVGGNSIKGERVR